MAHCGGRSATPNRTDVDDGHAVPGREHGAGFHLHAQERALQVDPQDAVPFVLFELRDPGMACERQPGGQVDDGSKVFACCFGIANTRRGTG
jgi:hypothetical protein